jgi:predicted kinase
MKTLLLLQGISGSGKTTYAKQWVEEDPENRIRLNYDDIRCMLGKYWVPGKREQLVKKIFDTALDDAMFAGYDIVIDNMSNLNPKHVKEYEELVEMNNLDEDMEQYEIKIKIFDTPIETCIERDSKREIPIGEKVIKEQWRKYRTYIIQQSIINMLENQVVQDDSLPHCIMVDMDATLCFNTEGRPFWGTEADNSVIKDIPNTPIVELVKHYKEATYGTNPYNNNRHIIIVTGRAESSREGTIAWLEKYKVPYDEILMRPNGSTIPGECLKEQLYNLFIKDKYYVDFVLEDSTKVVKKYRDLGLIVLQPNEGKF